MRKREAVLWLAAAWPLLAESGADARIRKIQERLIAPCCWSESVAVHRSGEAGEIRAEITGLVRAGKSESEIIERYVARYGERILLQPRGGRAVWLTAGPAVALGVGALGLGWYLYRRRPRAETAAPAEVPSSPLDVADADW